MSVKSPKTIKILLLLTAVAIYAYIYFRNVTLENVIGAILFIALVSVSVLICEFKKNK